MAEGLRHLARIATGTTAIGANTDAFTAVAVESGVNRILIEGTVDGATTIILRKNGVSLTLNEGVPLLPGMAFSFGYAVSGGDTVTVRFGTACNINDLAIKQE